MKFSSKDIIEIFSYTEDEQVTFDYLGKYMNLIKPKLQEIEKDQEKLKKFALIGLFLAYRACNYTGESLTTEIESEGREHLYAKRLSAIKEYFNIKILNTDHYLSMINFSIFDFLLMSFRLKNISKKFYKFVVK